jgi:type I restriction enzyme S subunit
MSGKYQKYSEYADSNVKWLGSIPSHWSIFSGKRLFRNVRRPSLALDEQLAASQKYGVVPQSMMMELNDSKVMLALKGTESFRHVDKNNFVISLRSFEGGIEHSDYEGCVSPAYTVLEPSKPIFPKYYKYLLKCGPYISALQSSTDSLRDGKSITFEQFSAIALACPEYTEQEQIASFLDHETAKIDTLIDKQQQLIKLLKEKRQAVISHAVTKGLNPDAPMKDSGVEWLGEVPEHWSVIKFGRLAYMQEGPGLRTWQFTDEGTRVICVTNITEDGIDFSKLPKFISEAEYSSGYKHFTVEKGDILLSSSGNSWGKVAVYEGDGKVILNTSTIRLNELPSVPLKKYFIETFLRSEVCREQLGLAMTGACQPNFGPTHLNEVMCPVPPNDEQIEIVDEVNNKTTPYERAIAIALNMINLLQERRTALISAAVTGKIDVRNWQPATAEIPMEASA